MMSFLLKNKIKNKNNSNNINLVIGDCYKIKKINGIIIYSTYSTIVEFVSHNKDSFIDSLNNNNISWENYPYKTTIIGPELNLKINKGCLVYDFDNKSLIRIEDLIVEDLGKCVFYDLNLKEEYYSKEDICKYNNFYTKVNLRDDLVPKNHINENFIAQMPGEDFEIYQDSNNVFYYTIGVSKYTPNILYTYKPRYVSCVLGKEHVVPKYRCPKDCVDIIKSYVGENPTTKKLNYLKKIGYSETYLKFYFKTWLNFISELNIPEEYFIKSKYNKWAYHIINTDII